jgi:acetyl-CoA carboxylase carboxyl transferase subunit beta
MIWLRKKLKKRAKISRVPEGLWWRCKECREILLKEEFEKNLNICPGCDYHYPMSPFRWRDLIIDSGTFQETYPELVPADPLGFKDLKKYRDRVKKATGDSLSKEAIIVGQGKIGGYQVQVGFFVFNFMGGSMGSVVGEKIARLFEDALKAKCACVIFSSSGGARMQEGILSLMQMAKTVSALSNFQGNRLPFISVLLNPTTGGVAASFAFLGDIIIAEPKALIGFAGPRVIEQTIRQKLPAGFQRSEFLLEHGMIDFIAKRKDMKSSISLVLSHLL